MKKTFILFGIIPLVGAAIWFFAFPHPKNADEIVNFPPNGNTVIAFGDSLVAGVGDPSGEGFVKDLEDDLGIEIINAGVPGDTTADGLARVGRVLSYDPDIVLLLLGGNDTLRRIPITETAGNLESILQKLQDSGAVIILLGVQGGLIGDPYEEMYAKLAEKHGTLYVSNILEDIIGNADLMSDRVHPNAKGYAIIAERIKPELKRLLETANQ